jgi:hypothetical protein
MPYIEQIENLFVSLACISEPKATFYYYLSAIFLFVEITPDFWGLHSRNLLLNYAEFRDEDSHRIVQDCDGKGKVRLYLVILGYTCS